MKRRTKPASPRHLGLQTLRGAWIRLSMTLLVMLLTATMAWAKNVDLSTLTENYEVQNGDVLTGTLSANVKVTIANSATMTLSGVSINANGTWNGEYAGLTCAGNATIVLADGTTNTVRGFNALYPGIYVPEGNTLTIQGDGSLDAIGGGAGIGGGYNIPCGNIVINGGTITATGGTLAAGIGGGYSAACGNITIGTGITQLTANGQGTYSIGAGNNGTCGTVTVCGVEGAITEKPFTCFHYTVHFDANSGTGTAMADQSFIYGIAQNLTANTYTRNGFTFRGWNTAANGAGTAYANQESVSKMADVTSGSTVTLYAQWNIPGLTYNAEGNYFEIPDATALNTLTAFVNAGHNCEGVTFKQTGPITLTDDFTPIGEHKSPGYYMFSGTYDGNNQTISGLNVNGDYSYAGLFGYLYKATVKNVILVSPIISSSTNNSGEYFAGALVGRTSSTSGESERSTITNCIVISPTVGFSNEGGTPYVGAIVGDIRGSYDQVTNCYFYDTQHTYTAIGDPTMMIYYPTVAQAHRITFGDHVHATNDISITNHPERGFTYNEVDYHRDGFEIELSSTGLVAETQNGYRVGFSVDGGQTWLDGNVLTVGTDCHDATVTASNTAPIDWATVTDGTENAPYLIKNTAQMELLARRVNNGVSDYSDKYFELDKDLIYDQNVANNHTAIGTAAHHFCGNFNGAGKVVAFVNINKAADYQGLFGYTDGATIQNIQLTDSEITGNEYVGGIVGYAKENTVTNCLLFRDAVTATTGGVIIGGSSTTTISANFHNASTYNNQKTGVSTIVGDVVGGAFGARKIILDENIAVDKDVTTPANGFPYGSQKYFRDGLELTVSYTGTVNDQYSVSFALNDTPIENDVLTVTPACDGKTIKPVFTVVKNPQTITYMKADGTTATHDALPLDGNETSLEAGEWYYVGENITFDHTLNLQEGDVTIILCDGKSMNFGESNNKLWVKSIDGAFSNLTIYGQSLDATKAGTLNIYTDKDYLSTCIDTKTYTQHSGNVNISAGKHYAIDVNAFTLAGGSLSIDAQSVAVWSLNDLTVSGGILDARTMSNNAVLQSYEGDIVLGWTNTTDRIYASSYSAAGKVCIADGQALKDANSSTFFMGTVANPNDIATKTLTPAVCYTFDCGTGAPTVDPVVADPGTVIAQPATPAWDGHTLLGWYTIDNIGPDGTAYDFSQAAYTCLTLYAKWTGLDYALTYDLASGELPEGKSNPATFTVESADITLVNPVRTGYTFAGWTGTALTEPTTTVTIATGSMGNRTYTATWTPIVYPIHYILDGGEVNEYTPNPTSYTIESDDIELNNPTREGYFFLGWTGTDLDGLTTYVTITKGNYGERTYTANWKKAKDFTVCTAVVSNPTYNNGYSVSSFYYYDTPIIKVWDSEGNLLDDTEYRFENMESIDYPNYEDNPCTRVGEHCRVTLEGLGDWIGQLNVDVVILNTDKSAVSALLSDTGNNSAVLTTLANTTVAYITLNDRKLYKDGDWNTLTLPFAMTAEQIAASPLAGATIKELLTSSNLDSDGKLTLNFSEAKTTIEAGKPYIVKWTAGDNITDPVFSGVTIDNSNRDVTFTGGTFKGNYSPLEITDANRDNILLLAAGNKLGYATTDRTIANGKALGAFRAYFDIPVPGAARSFELNFGDDGTTGIVDNKRETITNNHWYDLSGRKLSGKPTKKGVYIYNGKKVKR